MSWRHPSHQNAATYSVHKHCRFTLIPLSLTLLFVSIWGCRSPLEKNVSDTFVSTCVVTPAILKANTCLNFQKSPQAPCLLRLHGYTAPGPVLSAVDSDFMDMGWGSHSFNQFVKDMKPTLVPQETRSLTYYTASGYLEMNKALRGDVKLFKDHANIIYAAASGLNKLERFQGAVYRSENVDLSGLPAIEKTYKVGNIVVEEIFLSTTKMVENNFAGPPKASRLHIAYKIQSKTGREIDEFSMVPYEQEVLFAPGSAFRVLSFKKVVEEVAPTRAASPSYQTSLNIELEEIEIPK